MNKNKLSPYEEALIYAEDKDIYIIQAQQGSKIRAKALLLGEDMGVSINEAAFETEAERRLAFVHEVAHCETGGFYDEHTPEPERGKIDYRAKRRTVERLVSFRLYTKTILDGVLTEWEQAEIWNIPQQYVPVVHQVYESTHWEEVQKLKMHMLRGIGKPL